MSFHIRPRRTKHDEKSSNKISGEIDLNNSTSLNNSLIHNKRMNFLTILRCVDSLGNDPDGSHIFLMPIKGKRFLNKQEISKIKESISSYVSSKSQNRWKYEDLIIFLQSLVRKMGFDLFNEGTDFYIEFELFF